MNARTKKLKQWRSTLRNGVPGSCEAERGHNCHLWVRAERSVRSEALAKKTDLLEGTTLMAIDLPVLASGPRSRTLVRPRGDPLRRRRVSSRLCELLLRQYLIERFAKGR